MRQKGESASLAERLNNALAQQHAQKLAFDAERNEMQAQLQRANEENQRLRAKNRQLRRGREADEPRETDPEAEQVLLKVQHYLSRLQESAKQMAQVASQCRVFDAEIERASALIERNIVKTSSGLQKYTQELVRQWCHRETLRLENERLEKENKHLFELTTKLQQNFKQTDRLLKQLNKGEAKEDKYSQELRGRIVRLEQEREGEGRREAVGELEEKIQRLGQKVRTLQQENTTIKNIHQRTMKKLEKLEEKNRERGEDIPEGEGLQQERKRWLEKTEQMYEEVRRLTKELLLSEESERKVKEQLAGVLEIYGQWEVEREQRKIEIDKLKAGIQTYLQRIGELEGALSEAKGEIEAMGQRLQVSEGQKEKIVSVYQLEVQELNDLLFKKQDALTEMDSILNKEHAKLEELKKQHAQLGKFAQNLQDNNKKAIAEATDLRQIIREQQQASQKLKDLILQAQEATKQQRQSFEKQKANLLLAMEREKQEKDQMIQIMSQYKDEFYSAKKENAKLQEDLQNLEDEQFSAKQQLRSILSINDDSLDIWTLLAQTREHLKFVTNENKSLKESQRRLLLQYESKKNEASAQLQEMTQLYEALKQSTEDEKKNDEFGIKLLKMKIIEREICNEQTLSRVATLKELLEVVIGAVKPNSLPVQQQNHLQIQQFKHQIFTLQQNEKNLKEELMKTVDNSRKMEEELTLLRELQKDNDDTYREAEQNISQALRQLTQEKQLNEKLMEEIEALRCQRDSTNKEMVALASELNKIQNDMDDYQDEKTSIQSKLENARKISLKNEQLEQKIQRLQETIHQLEETIEELKENILDLNHQLAQKPNYDNNMPPQKQEENASELLDQDEPNFQSIDQVKRSSEQQQYLAQINALLQENSELQGEVSDKNMRIDQLEHSILLMNENHQLQLVKISKIQEELDRKNEETEEYRKICVQLEQEKEELTAMREVLQRKQNQAYQQNLENSHDYIQLTLDNEASMHQVDELEQRIGELEDHLIKKDQQITRLEEQLQQMKAIAAEQLKCKNDLIAREEELKISIARIHQKEAQLHKEINQLQIQKQRIKVTQAFLKQSEQQHLTRVDQLQQRERQLQLQELSMLKREEELKMLEKEICPEQRSHLGMQSMRQSKNFNHLPINTPEESAVEQLKEELNFAKRIIQEKQSNCQLKQSQVDELLQRQRENQIRLQYFQREVAQLEEELNEYKQHSEHLKSSLVDLTQEKQQVESYSAELKRQKDMLEANLEHLNQLLQESQLKNRLLSQQLEDNSSEGKNTIEALQAEIASQKQAISSQDTSFIQQEATIKQLTSLLAEKQQLLQQNEFKIAKQQSRHMQDLSQVSSMKSENEELHKKLSQMNNRCVQMEGEVASVKQQNMQYAQRLSEIEDLMEALRREEADSELLREKLEETLMEKQKLEDIVTNMENSFAFSTNNIAVFQKRNKELSQQLSASRHQQEVLKLNCDKSGKEMERYRESMAALKQALQKYEKLGTVNELTNKMQAYAAALKSCDDLKEKCIQFDRSNSQMKIKLQELERQLSKRNEQIGNKTGESIKLEEECRQLKELLRKNSTLDDQCQQLVNKNQQLRQDLEQCREQLLERQAKISELKQLHAKEQAQRQLLQSQLREKTIECQNLQQQAQHYKQEVKRIGKEKAQAKSQAIKTKFSLEEHQSSLKQREAELQQELKKHSSEKEEVIRQLRQEIDSLREHNSILQQQSMVDTVNRASRRSSTTAIPTFEASDMPLQIPRSRQKSVQFQEKSSEQKQEWQAEEEESRFMKVDGRLNVRLRESEKSNLSLTSQVEALRGELRGRQANIDTLERQFKSKVEDYSKLQRIVESLRDELNLQRKRVKNFEDLYQSIQEKRIKISNTKNE